MDHFKLLVQCMDKDELEKSFEEAMSEDNEELAKVISDELFNRNLNEHQ